MFFIKKEDVANHKYLSSPKYQADRFGDARLEGLYSLVRAFDVYQLLREEASRERIHIESFDEFVLDNLMGEEGEKVVVPDDFDYMGYDFEAMDFSEEDHDF